MFGKINPFGSKKEENESQLEAQNLQQNTDVDAQKSEKKGFVGGLKDKAVEKMLERQLKTLPPQQRELMMRAIQSNPEFFEKIARKIKEEEKKNGGNQMAASMKVMREHQKELTSIMKDAM